MASFTFEKGGGPLRFHQQPQTFVEKIVIKVANLERSLQFYGRILGLKIVSQSETAATLSANGTRSLLVIEQPEHVLPKQTEATGLYHVAFLLPDRSDLANAFRHLLHEKYPLQGASDHYVSEAVYLADPDGNGIELYADRSPSVWQREDGTVDMRTERLDMEDLLAAGDGSWTGLPAQTIIGHVHLQVSELKEIEEFYCRGLGFDVVMHYGGQALFVSTGGYHHHFAFNTWYSAGGSAPAENRVGLKQVSVRFPDGHTKRQAVERLQHLGAHVWEEGGLLLTKDPSGNVLHFI